MAALYIARCIVWGVGEMGREEEEGGLGGVYVVCDGGVAVG